MQYMILIYEDEKQWAGLPEAEMNKVTWPSEAEVYRATGVVIFVMFALAAVLYVFDGFWMALFSFLGVSPW